MFFNVYFVTARKYGFKTNLIREDEKMERKKLCYRKLEICYVQAEYTLLKFLVNHFTLD